VQTRWTIRIKFERARPGGRNDFRRRRVASSMLIITARPRVVNAPERVSIPTRAFDNDPSAKHHRARTQLCVRISAGPNSLFLARLSLCSLPSGDDWSAHQRRGVLRRVFEKRARIQETVLVSPIFTHTALADGERAGGIDDIRFRISG
jgi:hypothetical protein